MQPASVKDAAAISAAWSTAMVRCWVIRSDIPGSSVYWRASANGGAGGWVERSGAATEYATRDDAWRAIYDQPSGRMGGAKVFRRNAR